jgi:hypothetical protein
MGGATGTSMYNLPHHWHRYSVSAQVCNFGWTLRRMNKHEQAQFTCTRQPIRIAGVKGVIDDNGAMHNPQ